MHALGAQSLRSGFTVAGLVLLALLALQVHEHLRNIRQRLISERREPQAVVFSSLLAASRVARDWGHWDQMHDYVLRPTPGVLPDNIEPASVLENGGVMLAVHDDGRLLFSRGTDGRQQPRHLALLACARPNLAHLRRLSDVRFLACRLGRGVDYLGVATRVTDSQAIRAAPGHLMFFLPLRNPELGPGINAQVQRLAEDFRWVALQGSVPLAAGLEPLGLQDPVYGAEGQQLVLRRQGVWRPFLAAFTRDLALIGLLLSLALALRMVLMLQRRRSRLVQQQIERCSNSRVRRLGTELEAMLDSTVITPLGASRSDRVLARLMQGSAAADPVSSVSAPSSSTLEQRIQRLTGRFQAVLTRARALALLDPLTGLPNRRYFLEHLQLELERWRAQTAAAAEERSAAAAIPFAVILMDVDRFKIINDSYGHRTGDAVLKAVALRLQELIPAADFLARYGADELALWVDLSDREDQSAQALRQVVRERADALMAAFHTPLSLDALELTVSISFGVHLLDSAQDDGSDALKCANLAMVRAKAKRHSAVVLFDGDQDVSDLTSYQLYLDLIQAIRGDGQQLQVLFQPIFGPTGQVHAVEALARWTHPSQGPISPEIFLALAEQHRLMVSLGEELLRLTLEGFHPIHARDETIRLALNLHPTQLSDAGLVRSLLAQLQQHDLPASCLTVELTEQALLEQEPAVQANLQLLRQHGIALSLDDFGTGYSSLVLVGSLQPDEVKIDRSFAQSMLANAYAAQIVSLIISMARSLDLALVAEGVDRLEVLQALGALGVRRFQGFLLARPMSAQEMVERLDGRGFSFPTASALSPSGLTQVAEG